jgi:hypothetical protein
MVLSLLATLLLLALAFPKVIYLPLFTLYCLLFLKKLHASGTYQSPLSRVIIMTILHLRDLSAYGVVADVDPFNIPTNAFSYGLNVRFDDGSVERSVVFRNIDTTGGANSPSLLVDGSTKLGNATGGGNLASAFDGTTSQAAAASASLTSTTSIWIGHTLTTAKAIAKIIVYGTNDVGYVTGANPSITITAYGKNGTAPANGTDGTALGSVTFTDTANESGNPRTITVANPLNETTYEHVIINIVQDGSAATMAVAEMDTYEAVMKDEPRFITSFIGPSGDEELIIGYKDGSLSEWTVGGTETNQSISGYTPADSDGLFTACQLGGVLYVNRNDRVPWDWKPGDTTFEALANWTSDHRCNVLRAYNDALCAFNVTQGAAAYPTMVKTSDLTTYGAVPTTWDHTDPTNNATENILAEMKGAIVDAQTLQSSMIIYTNRETWVMQADGSDEVYAYRRLFNDAGAMSANCAVELEGKHYVFGYKDIWVHDGVGKESICDSRTRKRVFTLLDYGSAFRCFVQANETLSEIYFCYRDGAAEDADFASVDGCNKAAVYNYKNNTWSFITLPNVYAGDAIIVGNPVAYEDTDDTYDELSTSYFNVGESSKRTPIMVGDVDADFTLSASLYGLDLDGEQSILAFATDENATLNWRLEKEGCDLDELNTDLRGYKNTVAVYPQARLADDSMTIEFAFGSSDYFGVPASYEDYMTYNNGSLYKLDYKSGGRFLSFKARGTDGGRKYFRLSGMDFDVEITGER